MDKGPPKDVFAANRDRAAPLLKQLRADGIGHMLDGQIVPSISGDVFDTKSPVDGAVSTRASPNPIAFPLLSHMQTHSRSSQRAWCCQGIGRGSRRRLNRLAGPCHRRTAAYHCPLTTLW